jgi:D-xylose reductase
MSAVHTKYVTLNRTGDQLPLVGFGTARIPNEDTAHVVYTAIKNGYRLIDSALSYGNEAEVGQGVRKAIAEGVVKREEVFGKYKKITRFNGRLGYLQVYIIVVGKLWNHYHAKEHLRATFEKTRENYGLDYIDLYLVHCK